jgi:hypothetical protein
MKLGIGGAKTGPGGAAAISLKSWMVPSEFTGMLAKAPVAMPVSKVPSAGPPGPKSMMVAETKMFSSPATFRIPIGAALNTVAIAPKSATDNKRILKVFPPCNVLALQFPRIATDSCCRVTRYIKVFRS